MCDQRDPWIAISGRIPYIVAPLILPSSLGSDVFYDKVSAKFERAQNSLPAQLFVLRDDGEVLLAARNRKQFAIINLWSKPKRISIADRSVNLIHDEFVQAISKINALLGLDNTNGVTVEEMVQEISSKSMN